MTPKRKPPKVRNPHARALASGLFRQRVKPSAKVYRRRRERLEGVRD